ncbi:MAG TPA: hypothetical protein VG368_06420, partial [Acidimicrobiales bacterium]|nr:hypothetical protein [Acidimicrobiales bacterium]
FRAPGGSRWSDQAASLATATNGGLVLSSPNERSLLVGIRPTNLLHFSPLVRTTDGGRSWSPVAPLSGVADHPGALASDQTGDEIALVGDGGAEQVLTTSRSLPSWRTLTTGQKLATAPSGQMCALGVLTAVSYEPDNSALIGSTCERPGIVGVFARQGGLWRLVGPTLPSSLARGRVEVLNLQETNGQLSALLAISGAGHIQIVDSYRAARSGRWVVSPPLGLKDGARVVSFGPSGASGAFVLGSDSSGAEQLSVLGSPSGSWQALPPPPNRTATVAFGPGGKVDALSVDDTVMTDWALGPGSHRWTKEQVVNVAIQFGSSG